MPWHRAVTSSWKAWARSVARDPVSPVKGRVGPVCQRLHWGVHQFPLPFLFVFFTEAHSQRGNLEEGLECLEQCYKSVNVDFLNPLTMRLCVMEGTRCFQAAWELWNQCQHLPSIRLGIINPPNSGILGEVGNNLE